MENFVRTCAPGCADPRKAAAAKTGRRHRKCEVIVVAVMSTSPDFEDRWMSTRMQRPLPSVRNTPPRLFPCLLLPRNVPNSSCQNFNLLCSKTRWSTCRIWGCGKIVLTKPSMMTLCGCIYSRMFWRSSRGNWRSQTWKAALSQVRALMVQKNL